MLRLNLAAIALALASTAAIDTSQAADIFQPEGGSLKDRPVYAPVNTWTGFYIGGNGGYAWSANSNRAKLDGTDIDSVFVGEFPQDVLFSDATRKNFDSSGGFGGGQAGYNWQQGRAVFGVEADIQGSGVSGSTRLRVFPGDATDSASASSDLDWFGTVRGRLGYTFDHTLIFATGGFAFGGVKDKLKLTDDDLNVVKVSKDKTETGFVVGGGIEHALSPAWSVKAEYQYIDLGSTKLSASSVTADDTANASIDADHTYHTVRIGLNYHIHQDYEPLK